MTILAHVINFNQQLQHFCYCSKHLFKSIIWLLYTAKFTVLDKNNNKEENTLYVSLQSESQREINTKYCIDKKCNFKNLI